MGHPPSSRVEPYGGKPSAHSQTTTAPSPQVCNTYSSMALGQAEVFDIQFAEVGTLAIPLCPTTDPAGSLYNATIYSSELHSELAPRLCWLLERALVQVLCPLGEEGPAWSLSHPLPSTTAPFGLSRAEDKASALGTCLPNRKGATEHQTTKKGAL